LWFAALKPDNAELPLLGYVDQLSGHAGDVLNFKVSSSSATKFTATLHRSISADPNPVGIGIVEEDAGEYFPAQAFASRRQAFFPGSYGLAEEEVSAPSSTTVVFSASVFPTLKCDHPQTVLGLGDCVLYLDEIRVPCIRVGESIVSTGTALKLRHWYRIEATFSTDGIEVICQPLERNVLQAQPLRRSLHCATQYRLQGLPCVAAALYQGRATNLFNGKIEAPSITVNGSALCAWDFSENIQGTIVPAVTGPNLKLINFPTRAVTSSQWDGSEMNWTHKPEHYAAIHFHEDDIYDFCWETDFSFTVPDNMPSGVYVMRLNCEEHADAIPFFITAKPGQPQAKLCVLVSTFTYSIYGNNARIDFHPEWIERINDWNAYPHNPAEYPHYGLSTYNYHSDGSGICHASHRRPLFNLRPGYLTFGNTTCSGLRHFQADSHLISWLHNEGIEYDVVTDQDLHIHGSAAIAGYKVVTTGSHPEYHTAETLDALQEYRDTGGHLNYLGGNGFYWRIAVHKENDSMLEIRRAEDGLRAWAAEPGEYYNAFDGQYGGLWRRNGRAPQMLVGVGFVAQGNFIGDPYKRVCTDPTYDWIFDGIDDDIIGDFGFSGNGAAGYELDRMDQWIGTPDNAVLLARSVTAENGFMLVPEEQLTHLANLSGKSEVDTKHADMVWIDYPGGGSVFATGSITFCGSLGWNNFDNNVSQLLRNVLGKVLS